MCVSSLTVDVLVGCQVGSQGPCSATNLGFQSLGSMGPVVGSNLRGHLSCSSGSLTGQERA
jgi:hypothetical protein